MPPTLRMTRFSASVMTSSLFFYDDFYWFVSKFCFCFVFVFENRSQKQTDKKIERSNNNNKKSAFDFFSNKTKRERREKNKKKRETEVVMSWNQSLKVPGQNVFVSSNSIWFDLITYLYISKEKTCRLWKVIQRRKRKPRC